MGAGKTTVGRALAKHLNKRFVDSDHEIEARTGASVSLIFEIEGEQGFRQRESAVICQLTSESGVVVATGGGAVLRPENREWLKTRGTVIYLRTSVSHILHRTRHDKSRPLLRTADPKGKLEELTRQREPLYEEVADVVIDTGRQSVGVLVHQVIEALEAFWADGTKSVIGPEVDTTRRCADVYTVPMITLNVDLGARAYPILIGPHLIDHPELLIPHLGSGTVAIVTNETLAPMYLERCAAPLRAQGRRILEIVLPDGEQYKDAAHLARIYDVLLAHQCDRKTTLLALGGGVIGDMTGYAAATYMRGIDFVQIPTTLLAQVDSSVGGKTGINHPLGKNMIGAFYQPRLVLADIDTLTTLPERELSAGLAEVIKYGAVIDASFFEWLEHAMPMLRARDPAALTHAIRRSCELKADVVGKDERESGLRAILNFGHTFGHAIEAGMGYGNWLHGEAVGCGMVMAAELSHRLGLVDADIVGRLRQLVHAAGVPTLAPDLGFDRWVELMQVDKKNEAGQIRFILMNGLGQHRISGVDARVLEQAIGACVARA